MSVTFDGTGDLLYVVPTLVDSLSVPFWMSAWVKPDSVSSGSAECVISLIDESSVLADYCTLRIFDQAANARVVNGGVGGTAATGNFLTANNWHHVAASFDGPASRTVWGDVANTATNTTSTGNPSSLDMWSLGAENFSVVSVVHLSGEVAHVVVGAGSLTHHDVATLYAGFLPPRPIYAYWPLTQDLNDYGPRRKDTLTVEADAALDDSNPPHIQGTMRPPYQSQVLKDWVPYRFRYQEALRRT